MSAGHTSAHTPSTCRAHVAELKALLALADAGRGHPFHVPCARGRIEGLSDAIIDSPGSGPSTCRAHVAELKGTTHKGVESRYSTFHVPCARGRIEGVTR